MLNRKERVNQLIKYIETKPDENERKTLITMIDEDPLFLSDQAKDLLVFDYYGTINKAFTVAEYIILFSKDLDLVNYILSRLSFDRLTTFLSKEFSGPAITKVSGFHLLAMCEPGNIKAVLEALGDNNIDSLLEQKDNGEKNVPQAAVRSKDPSRYVLFLEKARHNKTKLLMNKAAGWTMLNLVLRYAIDTNDPVGYSLKPLNDNEAAEVISHVITDQWTALHQAMMPGDKKELGLEDIQILLDKLFKAQEKQKALTLMFNKKNQSQHTPYSLAKLKNRNDVVNLFFQKINFEDMNELREIIQAIEFDVSKYEDFFNKISSIGLLNLIALSNEKARSPFIERWIALVRESSPNDLSIDLVVALNELIRAYQKNMEKLVYHKDFMEVIKKIPDYALILSNIRAKNFYKKLKLDDKTSYRKLVFGSISNLIETNNQYGLDEKFLNELSYLISHAKKPYQTLFKALYFLLGQHEEMKKIGFDELTKFTEEFKFASVHYLLALCYRYGRGTLPDRKEAVNFYHKTYIQLKDQINSNLEDPDFSSLKNKLIEDVKKYFDITKDQNDQYAVAILLCQIYIAQNEFEFCRGMLESMSDTPQNVKQDFDIQEADLYLKLYEKSNEIQDLDRSCQLNHGNALVKRADLLLESNEINKASNFYRRALTVKKGQLHVREGMPKLKNCLEKIKSSEIMSLDEVASFVILARKEAVNIKLYQGFFEFLIKEFNYIPAKHAWACIQKLEQGKFLTSSEREQSNYLLVRFDFIYEQKDKKFQNKEYDYAQSLIQLVVEEIAKSLLPAEIEDCNEAIALAKDELKVCFKKSKDDFLKSMILMALAIIDDHPLECDAFKEAANLKDKQYLPSALDILKTTARKDLFCNIDRLLVEINPSVSTHDNAPEQIEQGLAWLNGPPSYSGASAPSSEEDATPQKNDDNEQEKKIKKLIGLAKIQTYKIRALVTSLQQATDTLKEARLSLQQSDSACEILKAEKKMLELDNKKLKELKELGLKEKKQQEEPKKPYNPFLNFNIK